MMSVLDLGSIKEIGNDKNMQVFVVLLIRINQITHLYKANAIQKKTTFSIIRKKGKILPNVGDVDIEDADNAFGSKAKQAKK